MQQDIFEKLENEDKIKQKIEELRNEISHHNRLYYEKAQPEISDYEYDQLVKKLEKLEAEYPQFKSDLSPAAQVSSDLTGERKVIEHKVRMYSLDNAYSLEEVKYFLQKIALENSQFPQVTLEHKLDGFSINLFYDKSNLQYATTRGNGYEGEDVTANIKTISSIPQTIDYDSPIEVRGEIFLPLNEFERINKERETAAENLFANPRNAAAGTIKLKNSKIVASRKLQASFYASGFFDNEHIKSQTQLFEFLKKQGLPLNKFSQTADDFAQIEAYCQYWDAKRHDLSFEIDGIVIKINDFKLREKLGYTSKSPKWAIAYKFKAEEKETILKEVQFQVGRTGAITPRAVLKPVHLSGTTVTHATLHNADEIMRLDLHLGDTVKIIKSGEIIPKITGVIKDKRPDNAAPVVFPANCPVCNTELHRDQDGAIYYCNNIDCPAQIHRRLTHFASRAAVDIDGLGEALIQQLIDNNLISKIEDIYDLDYSKVEKLERQAAKSVHNLNRSIQNSKQQKFYKILFGFGIRYVGDKTARLLAQHFRHIDALIQANRDDLLQVEEVGEKIAESILEFFANPLNLQMIAALKKAGINLQQEDNTSNSILAGKSFLITGTLQNYKRQEIKDLITSKGGNVVSAVSKNLDFLLVGENPGSKLDKARKLSSVQIISEPDFEEMLK